MIDASTRGYKNSLVEALTDFKCYKDKDVQDFLNKKAINFEKRGLSTTYMLLNQECLKNGVLKIEGYFSLTHKAVLFDENVSGSLKNKLTGAKQSTMHSFVLIGQLGKYMENIHDKVISSELTSQEILNDAINIISKSSDYITCRNIIIECKPIDKIYQLYCDYGFTELQSNKTLHTLYLKLAQNIDF